jgi:hypothetical protein
MAFVVFFYVSLKFARGVSGVASIEATEAVTSVKKSTPEIRSFIFLF